MLAPESKKDNAIFPIKDTGRMKKYETPSLQKINVSDGTQAATGHGSDGSPGTTFNHS